MANTYSVNDNFSRIPAASPSAFADNENWKLVGSGTAAADPVGGVKLTNTSGASSFQPVSTSGLGGTTWLADSQTKFLTQIRTPASLANLEINVGLATHPAVTDETAINPNFPCAFILYEPKLSPNFILAVSKGDGTLHQIVSSIKVLPSTSYLIEIDVDPNFNVFFFINGQPGYFNPVAAFGTGDVLIPYIGLSGASSLTVQNSMITQNV